MPVSLSAATAIPVEASPLANCHRYGSLFRFREDRPMNMPQTATPSLASQLKLDAHWMPFS